MGDDRLNQDEIALVLQRAAELDAASTTPTEDGITVSALEATAAEVGLAPAAVQQAVAELRAGMLVERPDEANKLVLAREVPLEADEAANATERYLKRQLFVKVRDRNGIQRWRPRDDWGAGLQRGLDFSAALRLNAISEVVVRTASTTGGSIVRLETTLKATLVHAPRIVGGGLGIAGVAGGVALLATGSPEGALWVSSTGVVTGGAAYAIGRTGMRGSVRKATESLEGFLDDLERGKRPRRRGSR